MHEIYILQKHAGFSAEYIENIPIYKRRFYLNQLREEIEAQKKAQDDAIRKANSQSSSRSFRR
jgi:hypothetical protein